MEGVNCCDRTRFLRLHQIGYRPGAQVLIAADRLPHAHKLTHQAAQKLHIAMIPVRDQGMREERDGEFWLHATAAPSPRLGESGFDSLGWEAGVPGEPGFGLLGPESGLPGEPCFGFASGSAWHSLGTASARYSSR